MINTSCETHVIVLNYGVNSMTAGQNRARLMDVGVQPQDIVVFHGGGNDVYYSVYFDEPLCGASCSGSVGVPGTAMLCSVSTKAESRSQR
jgi:hypothetical protein